MTPEEKLLKAAEKVIRAQDRLLIAYRCGGRPPAWVFDDLSKYKPVWDAHLTDIDARKDA